MIKGKLWFGILIVIDLLVISQSQFYATDNNGNDSGQRQSSVTSGGSGNPYGTGMTGGGTGNGQGPFSIAGNGGQVSSGSSSGQGPFSGISASSGNGGNQGPYSSASGENGNGGQGPFSAGQGPFSAASSGSFSGGQGPLSAIGSGTGGGQGPFSGTGSGNGGGQGPFSASGSGTGGGQGPFSATGSGTGGGQGPFSASGSGNGGGEGPFSATGSGTGGVQGPFNPVGSGNGGGQGPFSAAAGGSGGGQGPFSGNGNGGGQNPFNLMSSGSGKESGYPFDMSKYAEADSKLGPMNAASSTSGMASPFTVDTSMGGPGGMTGSSFEIGGSSGPGGMMGGSFDVSDNGLTSDLSGVAVDNSVYDTKDYEHMLQEQFQVSNYDQSLLSGNPFDGSSYDNSASQDTLVNYDSNPYYSLGSYSVASGSGSNYMGTSGHLTGFTGTGSTNYNKGNKYGTPFDGSYDQLVANPITSHSTNVQSYNQGPSQQTYVLRPGTSQYHQNSNQGSAILAYNQGHDASVDFPSPFAVKNGFLNSMSSSGFVGGMNPAGDPSHQQGFAYLLNKVRGRRNTPALVKLHKMNRVTNTAMAFPFNTGEMILYISVMFDLSTTEDDLVSDMRIWCTKPWSP